MLYSQHAVATAHGRGLYTIYSGNYKYTLYYNRYFLHPARLSNTIEYDIQWFSDALYPVVQICIISGSIVLHNLQIIFTLFTANIYIIYSRPS